MNSFNLRAAYKITSLVYMNKNYESSIWEAMSTASAMATDSERYLAKLAKRAFLNFWSYSNPYTDEGEGKELCDFLVVFGNDVLIFSDKHCKFPNHQDIKVSWHRWFRSAIKKSVDQLTGAASFIERFPTRIYIDSACKIPLPVPLPPLNARRVHLIAVTRGSAEAAKNSWGNGSSSSLIINTAINGLGEKDYPFMIGRPLHKKRFIHILDELTLDILLTELDTASDFVDYLVKKEEFLSSANLMACGEEELLAAYLSNPLPDFNGFSFPQLPHPEKLAILKEGGWSQFCRSDAYSLWKEHLELSYEWDRLIEYQTSHIQRGTAGVLHKYDADIKDLHAHELVLRKMAEEGRLTRRHLAESYDFLLSKQLVRNGENRFFRALVGPVRNNRAYVLLVLICTPGQDYDEYREARRESLAGYCRAIKLRVAGIEEVVGIASDPKSSPISTQDFLYMECRKQFSQEEKEAELAFLRSLGIWKEQWVCV
ncbi:hypothetical protein ACL6MW_01560 [Pseudomonas putida]|uniref:hypothetical protein n=1 Tax=Pseudomonas putida TaxID=303 RepID=UPI00126845CD|nr:hypothetical protein [Pseudomonas putida]HEE9764454.1 hypothetical protein [Pseudomonas putida]